MLYYLRTFNSCEHWVKVYHDVKWFELYCVFKAQECSCCISCYIACKENYK